MLKLLIHITSSTEYEMLQTILIHMAIILIQNSKITTETNRLENENFLFKNSITQISTKNARLINQYRFKYQTVFSATFDKQDEDDQVLDEIELYISLNITKNQQSLILVILMLGVILNNRLRVKRQGIVVGDWIELVQ